MIRTAAPKLRMLAGPNGSGKSTLFRYLRETFNFPLGFWQNADEIDRELISAGRLYLGAWGVHVDDAKLAAFVESHGLAKRLRGPIPRVVDGALIAGPHFSPGYFTSIFCDMVRRSWMSKGESFTFETVMSHPDRVDFVNEARDVGYRTYLYYICTDSPLINAGRIGNRVAQGGHHVAEDVVTARYSRSLSLLPRAIASGTRAYLFDNSDREHRFIAEYDGGLLVRAATDLPGWFIDHAPKRGMKRRKRRQ